MKRNLRLRSDALTDLAPDELGGVVGGLTNASCLQQCTRPVTIVVTGNCPTSIVATTTCPTMPVNECLISYTC